MLISYYILTDIFSYIGAKSILSQIFSSFLDEHKTFFNENIIKLCNTIAFRMEETPFVKPAYLLGIRKLNIFLMKTQNPTYSSNIREFDIGRYDLFSNIHILEINIGYNLSNFICINLENLKKIHTLDVRGNMRVLDRQSVAICNVPKNIKSITLSYVTIYSFIDYNLCFGDDRPFKYDIHLLKYISKDRYISDLPELQYLNINYSKGIQHVKNLPNLRILHCLDNRQILTIKQVPRLDFLDCSRTKIAELPSSHNLVSLNCEISNVKKIPYYPKLQVLKCGGTKIKHLKNLYNLRFLDCSNTAIINLPITPQLEFLNCSGCPIYVIPPMKYLIHLNFYKCPFIELTDINEENFPSMVMEGSFLI